MARRLQCGQKRKPEACHMRLGAGDRYGRTGTEGDVVVLPHDGDVVRHGPSVAEACLQEVACPEVVQAQDGGMRRERLDPFSQASLKYVDGAMVFLSSL